MACNGAVICNPLSTLTSGREIKAFKKKAWQSTQLRKLNFSVKSPSVMQHMDTDFASF